MDDRVLVVGFENGRVKAINRTFEGHWVMAYTIRNGKVMNVREYFDSLTLARAFDMAAKYFAPIDVSRIEGGI